MMQLHMARAGYTSLQGLDYSAGAVAAMMVAHDDLPGVSYRVADCRSILFDGRSCSNSFSCGFSGLAKHSVSPARVLTRSTDCHQEPMGQHLIPTLHSPDSCHVHCSANKPIAVVSVVNFSSLHGLQLKRHCSLSFCCFLRLFVGTFTLFWTLLLLSLNCGYNHSSIQ